MTTPEQIQSAIKLLEDVGQYRIIKALPKPAYQRDPNVRDPNASRPPVVCVIVDSEATSSDPASAIPIELGMLKVGFDPGDPASIVALDSLEMLNDPGIASTEGAQAAHGIAPEELVGKSFDQERVAQFLQGVDYVIAHNARYDRPVLSRAIPVFDEMRWQCSMKEVDWAGLGISSRALDYLIYKAGYFHAGHRALADCEALLAVLSHQFLEGISPLQSMHEGLADKAWILLCVGAPFETKDAMKQRGYRWNPGDTPGDVPVKCWSTPEIIGKPALLDELAWLESEGYKRRAGAAVMAIPMTAATRYSEGARLKAYTSSGKREVVLRASIAKLTSELAPASEAPVPARSRA